MQKIHIIILLSFTCAMPTISYSNILTDDDIQDIYNQHVKPNFTLEYRMRYVPLPMHKNTTSWRWEGKDFPRVIALLEFERFVKENNITCTKGLSINDTDPTDPEWLLLPTKEIIRIDYDKNPQKYDLHSLDITEKNFDFVMCNQTFEHTYDPIRCLKNIYKHMQAGGILYFNVPADNILHATPFHYYTGYTPVGIGAIVKAAGFKILSIGQWGNLEYLLKMHGESSWPDYRQLKNPGINDVDHPVIVWVFAKK